MVEHIELNDYIKAQNWEVWPVNIGLRINLVIDDNEIDHMQFILSAA